MAVSDHNLIWVDLEMTGLIPEAHRVIEIATIVTDSNLSLLAEGPVLAIHQPPEALDAMDEWNTRTHMGSGLVDRVRASIVSESAAAELTLEFLRQWVPEGKSPMCGNSICQDRRFMARHMPELETFFHYRNLDVSTLKILMQRWRPDLPDARKQGLHQARPSVLPKPRVLSCARIRQGWLRPCLPLLGLGLPLSLLTHQVWNEPASEQSVCS